MYDTQQQIHTQKMHFESLGDNRNVFRKAEVKKDGHLSVLRNHILRKVLARVKYRP